MHAPTTAPRRSTEHRRRFVAALAAAALIASCAGPSEDELDPDPSLPSGHDLLAAAVRVEAFGCHTTATVGGGSFIAGERIITVAHVVAGSQRVEVVLADGRHVEAVVIAIDRIRDLAILHAEAPVSPLTTGAASEGDSGGFATFRTGLAATIAFRIDHVLVLDAPDIDGQGSYHRQGFELNADVMEGDSGSVLVSHGMATGVVFARSSQHPGRAFAIDISEADPLLLADDDSIADTGACVANPD